MQTRAFHFTFYYKRNIYNIQTKEPFDYLFVLLLILRMNILQGFSLSEYLHLVDMFKYDKTYIFICITYRLEAVS